MRVVVWSWRLLRRRLLWPWHSFWRRRANQRLAQENAHLEKMNRDRATLLDIERAKNRVLRCERDELAAVMARNRKRVESETAEFAQRIAANTTAIPSRKV